jgi:hypothetical protein
MRLVKLTNAYSLQPVWVNPKAVLFVRPTDEDEEPYNAETLLTFAGFEGEDATHLYVTEICDTIVSLLEIA